MVPARLRAGTTMESRWFAVNPPVVIAGFEGSDGGFLPELLRRGRGN